MDKIDIEKLFIRFCQGDVTQEEVAMVERLLSSCGDNQDLFDEIQAMDFAAKQSVIEKEIDVNKSLKKVHSQINPQYKKLSMKYVGQWFQRIAAVLLIPLLCVVIYILTGRQSDISMIEMRTQPGMVASVILPDSSVVVMNSSSVLRYPSVFNGNVREVELNGEAFFNVTKDYDKRFIVNTPHDSKIIVYGTEFNVEAYEFEKIERTTLVSGKVGFSFMRNGKNCICMMSPEEKVVYNSSTGAIRKEKAYVEVETSWKDGKLIFRNTPFDQILRRVGRYYNVSFVMNDKKLANLKFTGVFKHQSLENVLKGFNISSDIEFEFKDSGRDTMQVIEVYNPKNIVPMDR